MKLNTSGPCVCVEVFQEKCLKNTAVSTLRFFLNPAGRLHTRSFEEKRSKIVYPTLWNKQAIREYRTIRDISNNRWWVFSFFLSSCLGGGFFQAGRGEVSHKNSPVAASAVTLRFGFVSTFVTAVGEGRSTKRPFTAGGWVALLLLHLTEPPVRLRPAMENPTCTAPKCFKMYPHV